MPRHLEHTRKYLSPLPYSGHLNTGPRFSSSGIDSGQKPDERVTNCAKNDFALERAIDLERMQLFQGKREGVLFEYEPTFLKTPYSYAQTAYVSFRIRLSKLLDNGVVGESMPHYYPEFHGVPQEAHSGEASVKEKVWEAEVPNQAFNPSSGKSRIARQAALRLGVYGNTRGTFEAAFTTKSRFKSIFPKNPP
ncbi:hypothetical protein C8R48DRAFT_679151 [Suillus tomentosus]|nr:hypothetical protein C8R48DRAFT_679151 [Suillus tomentosus]